MSRPAANHRQSKNNVASLSIAPRAAKTDLTPVQLEERATIYRSDQSRAEVDAFRDLRTRVLSVTQGGSITLVAPVSRGSGGSYVARNLATAVSFDESRSALLVDCDLRYPSQQATLQLNPGKGLIDYLEDRDAEADHVIHDTGIARLQLLPAGDSREMASEFLSSPRLRLLLDTVRTRSPNCHIFLDAPPVRGAPDARILSELADIVVLVAGYGRDTPSAIAQAAADFSPAKFAGVVFNEGV